MLDCLLHNLSPSPSVHLLVWHPPLMTHSIIHFFTESLSYFTAHDHTTATCFSVVPRLYCLYLVCSLSLSHIFSWNSIFYPNVIYLSDHSHFCPLMYHLIFFFYTPGFTSMHHSISHTTAVQTPSHNQWYIIIDKQWYLLPEFIPSSSNSGFHCCISISMHAQHVT